MSWMMWSYFFLEVISPVFGDSCAIAHLQYLLNSHPCFLTSHQFSLTELTI